MHNIKNKNDSDKTTQKVYKYGATVLPILTYYWDLRRFEPDLSQIEPDLSQFSI